MTPSERAHLNPDHPVPPRLSVFSPVAWPRSSPETRRLVRPSAYQQQRGTHTLHPIDTWSEQMVQSAMKPVAAGPVNTCGRPFR